MAAALTAAQFFALRRLSYSTSELIADTDGEEAPPSAGRFRVGPLSFDVTAAVAAPSLAPFREEFMRSCAGHSGVEAAVCASRTVAARVPFGTPRSEFVSANYEPAAALNRHFSGEPGHCLTISALSATMLLASGIPARVVQVISKAGVGHTIIEVWDAGLGWVLVDSTFAVVITDAAGPTSAARASRNPQFISSQRFGTPWVASTDRPYDGTEDLRFAGQIVFPEPWLYTRIGARRAPWPLRGAFAYRGVSRLTIGPAQQGLRAGILVSSLGTFVCAALAVMARRARGRAPRSVREPPRADTSTEHVDVDAVTAKTAPS